MYNFAASATRDYFVMSQWSTCSFIVRCDSWIISLVDGSLDCWCNAWYYRSLIWSRDCLCITKWWMGHLTAGVTRGSHVLSFGGVTLCVTNWQMGCLTLGVRRGTIVLSFGGLTVGVTKWWMGCFDWWCNARFSRFLVWWRDC